MKSVAVTGSLGSGKSTVCQILHSFGALALYSDHIIHQLLHLPHIISQVQTICGHEVIREGEVDRKAVADVVFQDSMKRKKLENFLHPLAFAMIQTEYKTALSKHNHPLFVVEAPLLFEAGWESFFDVTVAVIANPIEAERRYVASGHSPSDYRRRVQSQMAQEQKQQRADFVIQNQGNPDDLKHEVKQLFSQLTKSSEE